MSRRPHRSVPALVALLSLGLSLGLAGCSDDEDPGTGSTSSSAAPSGTDTPSGDTSTGTTGAGPCGVVTDARLSELTGRPQTVGDLTTVGRRQECRTVREPDDALRVTWGFEPLQEDDPDYVVESEGFGLEEGSVDLQGDGAPVAATLLTGEDAGARTVKVVVPIGDQVLVTEATSEEAAVGGEGAPDDVLQRVAVGIAEDYLVSGIPVTSAG